MTGTPEEDHVWLAHAVELATASVDLGGGPFGAVIVRDDALVSTGQNRVTSDDDPTAHAEIVAIRTAASVLRSHALPTCTLYTSCEPCPMCLSAALWARLDRVVYAADRLDAARSGFDDLEFYELLQKPRERLPVIIEQLTVTDASAPFTAWLEHAERIPY